MKIDNFDTEKRVLIVAEIGNNHEGDFSVAQELVRKAAQCKVDAVKFQTFRTEYYVSQSDTARFERLKSFELTNEQFGKLAALAHELGLLFLSTPFDLGSASMLEPLVDAFKISSGDNTFYPLIGQVARTGKPMIISTGLADIDDVRRAVDFVQQEWQARGVAKGQLALLQCVAAYPVPHDQVNLRAISFLAEQFPDVTVGYSDHTDGTEAAVLAVALGARIVEEHFTLDKQFSDFRDHQLSSDPMDMTKVVTHIRAAERMLGEKAKTIVSAEAEMPSLVRRSIVAAHDLPKGYVVTLEDLTWVRPAGGLAPGKEEVLIGKKLKRDVKAGERLQEEDVVAVKERERVAT